MSSTVLRESLSDGNHESNQLPNYYTPDGSNNNPSYPEMGSINTPRIRSNPPMQSYLESDWHTPRYLDLPSPHKIFVDLLKNAPKRENEKVSQLLIYVGHFITRDVTRSLIDNTSMDMPIECDVRETRGTFCPMGREVVEFHRLAREESALNGGGEDNVGASNNPNGLPLNFATTWLDMDNIYGNALPSSPDYLKFRTGVGGKMKLAPNGLPPLTEEGLYLVYDDNLRRLPGDLALSSTFLAYHNRRAEHHAQINPEWDDETLYREARMDVIAAYQKIVEDKYLTALLGQPLEPYSGYKPSIDPRIDVFFSTSSFRYGHSVVSGLARLVDEDLGPLPSDPLLLRDIFKRTEDVLRNEVVIDDDPSENARKVIQSALRGLLINPAKAPDASFVDDMVLFMDGVVLRNIQRGRDIGLASYNDAREWFGRERAISYLEIANGDEAVANSLEILYGEGNVDDVDAYVGAMLESPSSKHDVLGPLNRASIRDQFRRLRDGDRLWFRNRLSEEEIQELPTLTDLIREAWGAHEMRFVPDDTYAIVGTGGQGGGVSGAATGQGGLIELFEGDMSVSWTRERRRIDVTISTLESISGGFVGLGWGSNAMKGAEIWFCTTTSNFDTFSESCDSELDSNDLGEADRGPFSCCVAQGKQHIRPECDADFTYLNVVSSCSSSQGSYVKLQAQLCSDGNENKDCFSHGNGGDAKFIAAYNPLNSNAAHGFSRRTSGSTNFALGTAATCSDDSAQAGLFALHGATLLFAWLVLAPIAIYVIRYMKHKPWRIRVHISLVGVIGGLMLSLVSAALVSVEGTSFGTVDAESSVFSRHKIFGLSIMVVVVFMIFTGELRRTRVLTRKTKSLMAERAVIFSHRIGGLTLVGLAWMNCYLGLIQISPYESDSVEVTLFSAKTVSLGYDLEFFGFFQKYLFFPWIAIVVVVFLVSEIKMRRALSHNQYSSAEESKRGSIGNGLMTVDESELESITVDTFLFLTKHGHSLSIFDGFVIDIGNFIDFHPGGTNVLKFAIGSDITPFFTGDLDIDGIRHMHSTSALKSVQRLVKWKLEEYVDRQSGPAAAENERRSTGAKNVIHRKTRNSLMSRIGKAASKPNVSGHLFRTATVCTHEIISGVEKKDEKYMIRLCVEVKKEEHLDMLAGTPLPTTHFVFRVVDKDGNAFERPYSASQCTFRIADEKDSNRILPLYRKKRRDKETAIYEFLITILPHGRMSNVLRKKTPGKHLMVKGPLASDSFLRRLKEQSRSDICIIAQGAGITPALQLVDHYLHQTFSQESLNICLVWLVNRNKNRLRDAVELTERAKSSPFRFVIVDSKGPSSPKKVLDNTETESQSSNGSVAESDAKHHFYNVCRSKSILNKETIEALLSWVFSGENFYDATSEMEEPECSNEFIVREEQNKDNKNLLVAICGHSLFETDLSAVLIDVGIGEEQVFRFPSGHSQLATLREFFPKSKQLRKQTAFTWHKNSERDFATV